MPITLGSQKMLLTPIIPEKQSSTSLKTTNINRLCNLVRNISFITSMNEIELSSLLLVTKFTKTVLINDINFLTELYSDINTFMIYKVPIISITAFIRINGWVGVSVTTFTLNNPP